MDSQTSAGAPCGNDWTHGNRINNNNRIKWEQRIMGSLADEEEIVMMRGEEMIIIRGV